MARKTFAEIMQGAKLLVEALRRRVAGLPTGVTGDQLTKVEMLQRRAEELNQQQEKLKADLKVKTAELDAVVKELEAEQAVVRKYTKLGTKQEEWREFGIEDKR